MGLTSAIIGGIGGLCAILGILTILDVIPQVVEQFDWVVWFALSVILLLGSIAMSVARGGEGGYD